MAKIKPLKQCRIFSSLTDRELALFSRVVTEEDYIKGTVLVAENMKSDRFFLIEKGRISIKTGQGSGSMELILGEGETFGEWALIAPAHLTEVSARVLDEARVLVITREDFNRFAEEDPAVVLKVIRGLVSSLWPSLQDARRSLREGL
jgi:CRP-like cAMP-binding protein